MTDEFIRLNIEPIVAAYDPDDSDDYGYFIDLARALGGKLYCGASRLCIVLPNDDEVVKMPYLSNCHIDYNEREYHNWKAAKDYGIQKVLLPTRYFGEYDNGMNIYIQKKYSWATCDSKIQWMDRKMRSTSFRRILDCQAFIDVRYNIGDCIAKEWLAFVWCYYGRRFVESFLEWKNACEVTDLHNGNTGFLHGKPILLDYAGYDGSGFAAWASLENSSENYSS